MHHDIRQECYRILHMIAALKDSQETTAWKKMHFQLSGNRTKDLEWFTTSELIELWSISAWLESVCQRSVWPLTPTLNTLARDDKWASIPSFWPGQQLGCAKHGLSYVRNSTLLIFAPESHMNPQNEIQNHSYFIWSYVKWNFQPKIDNFLRSFCVIVEATTSNICNLMIRTLGVPAHPLLPFWWLPSTMLQVQVLDYCAMKHLAHRTKAYQTMLHRYERVKCCTYHTARCRIYSWKASETRKHDNK